MSATTFAWQDTPLSPRAEKLVEAMTLEQEMPSPPAASLPTRSEDDTLHAGRPGRYRAPLAG